MELKDKIELRKLAIKCSKLENEIFDEEDSDYVDYRIIRNKEMAIKSSIDKMSEISGIKTDTIYEIVYSNPFETWKDYFNKLRENGIEIASSKEMESYQF